jgi:sugar lactone lactonase YvrE
MTNSSRARAHFAARFLLATASLGALSAPVTSEAKQVGAIETLAAVPATPGFPEGIAVSGKHVYVSSPARFGTAGTGPSTIHVFHKNTGALLDSIEIQGEDLSSEHALTAIALDSDDRLYVLSTQLGVVRLEETQDGFVQDIYSAPLPDLPTCASVPAGEPCSLTSLDLPPLPNDIAFDANGDAFVTDSQQGVIFRIPAGGSPEIWFQSALFDPPSPPLPSLSLNGIRLSPDRSSVYVALSFSGPLFPLGGILKLPLVDSPAEADMQLIHSYFGELPDGIAFGESGRLYVALALSNQISVLEQDGSEVARIVTPAGVPVPLDAPANIAFDDAKKALLVTNHALLTGDPAHFAVLRVSVGEKGSPLEQPQIP